MHLGVHALAMEERGLETERGDRFQEIRELNKAYELERSQHLEDEKGHWEGRSATAKNVAKFFRAKGTL